MESILVILNDMPTWALYVSVIVGILSCFLGYKLLKIWMALIGFVIGMTVGYLASYQYVSNMVIPILIGFLLGVIVGFIAYRIYLLGVFSIAFLGTFGFTSQLLAHYNEAGGTWLVVALGLSIVVAVLALKFAKSVLIISSALNGALMVMLGVFDVLEVNSDNILWLASVLLAILGAMVQFFTNKKTDRK